VPRTGDVLRSGGVAGGVAMDIAGYAPGRFGTESGNTAQRGPVSPLVFMAVMMQNLRGMLRIGVADGVEAETQFGYQELALGARLALLQEAEGGAASVAFAATGTYRPTAWGDGPIFARDGFGARAGFDVSRHVSDGAALDWNPYVSYGPEAHVMGAKRDQPCEGFGGENCGEYGPDAYAYALRREVRIESSFGATFDAADESRVSVGLVPYYTAWAARPTQLVCKACDDAAHAPFVEDWGVHLVFAGDFGGR
jgi:hypothetical protein